MTNEQYFKEVLTELRRLFEEFNLTTGYHFTIKKAPGKVIYFTDLTLQRVLFNLIVKKEFKDISKQYVLDIKAGGVALQSPVLYKLDTNVQEEINKFFVDNFKVSDDNPFYLKKVSFTTVYGAISKDFVISSGAILIDMKN